MIRVFVDQLTPMRIVELQGRLDVPAHIVPDTVEEVRRQLALRGDGSGEGGEEADRGSSHVLVGCIAKNAAFPSRHTLRLGTLRVDGTTGKYRHPILVLRRRHRDAETESPLPASLETLKGEGEGDTNSAPRATADAMKKRSAVVEEEEEDEEDVDAIYQRLTEAENNSRVREEVCSSEQDDSDTDNSTNTSGSPRTGRKRRRSLGSSSPGSGGAAELFSQWVQRNPQELALETHYSDAALQRLTDDSKRKIEEENRRFRALLDACVLSPSASATRGSAPPRGNRAAQPSRQGAVAAGSGEEGEEACKDYDIVGVVEDYILFNSKPARVFR